MATKTTISEVLKVLDRQGVYNAGVTIDNDNYVTVAFMLSDQDQSLELIDKVGKVLSRRMTVYVKNVNDPSNYQTIRGVKNEV